MGMVSYTLDTLPPLTEKDIAELIPTCDQTIACWY